MNEKHRQPLLRASGVKTYFPLRGSGPRAYLRAVDDVSLYVGRGETLGLVGESGCGKSTLGRTLMRLLPANAGEIRFDGVDMSTLSGRRLRRARLGMQMIFQNPAAALNPRMTVLELISDAPLAHRLLDRAGAAHRAAELLRDCGLSATQLGRYPHEFSGGQRQRINIARALALEPKLIICDEAVSALDVSVQAQIVNLLKDLQRDRGLSYLFISHDIGVVRYLSHRIAVMYLGRIVETGPREALLEDPKHPYTQTLLAAVPGSGRRRLTPRGETPSAARHYTGCAFAERCPQRFELCDRRRPELTPVGAGQYAACHLYQPAGDNGEPPSAATR